MNTDTRRHAEKTSYHRKSKYKEDLLDDEELASENEQEDQGVMSDFKEEGEQETPEDQSRGRR